MTKYASCGTVWVSIAPLVATRSTYGSGSV
jgi:hypothetical protein